MPEDEFSGVAAVRRDGVTVAERAGGMADRDLGLPVAPGTRFQIASVSKQFTAAAVLLLASRSRLALDDPVGRWLGGGPPGWESITVAHLLAHTSGLGHWPDYPGLDVYARIEAADELAFFQARPLLSAPGSRYRYSSPGYVLLAWIVERVTGQPYAGFLAGEVLGPLGLTSASAGDPPGGPGMARGYRAGEPLASADLATVSIGAGDLWCSVPDLLRWDEAIGGDELLPAAFREAMFTVHAPGSPGGEGGWSYGGYGYGWRIGTYRGHRARYHAGDNPGYLSLNAWLPDDRVTLAVLVNDEATDILAVADGLLRVAT